MSVEFSKNNEELCIKLSGRLDMAVSLPIGEQVEKKITPDVKRVVFDLENLQYISSAGLRILVYVAKEMQTRGGTINTINYSDSIKKVLDITDFFELCTE